MYKQEYINCGSDVTSPHYKPQNKTVKHVSCCTQ